MKKVAFVYGNFNIFHPGHLRLLKFAKESSDYLIVGVNSDKLANNSNLLEEDIRLESIKSTSYVDEVFLLNEDVLEYIKRKKPDILVKGKEFENRYNPEEEIMKTYGGKILFSSGEIGFSSLNLLQKDFEISFLNLSHDNNFIKRHKIEKTKLIAKQKELFEKLYSKSADGVLLIKDNKIIDCNEASLKILQYEKDELLNKFLPDISPKYQLNGESSNIKAQEKINETITNGISSFEWIFQNKDLENLWIEIVLTYIEIDDVPLIHTVIRDINKRKKMEKELESLTYKLEERIAEEIKKNKEKTNQLIQQSRLAQMGEMISMIAHQWRQPLAAISATTNNLLLKIILGEKIENKDLEVELKLINDYSQHLSLTIDDFRNFFRSDKIKFESSLKEIIQK
ncbi:MAG: adenylyltransferase/cytidyltransferase family protein, partial [Arcobacter sp.]|nr:adenylyltransferase/cytidyltransferase family protein [Arcobacter sp.]